MTYRVRVNRAALVAASCLVVAGCNASAAPPPAQAGVVGQAATMPQRVANISGDYTGSVQDSQGGSGTAKATLAQHRAEAGGAIKDRESNQTIALDVSLTVSSTNATSGAMVVDYPPAGSGPVCTYSTTGTFDPTTNMLSGSYAAVAGCTGDTGTYTLTQQCHDTVVTGALPRRSNNPHC
jgi:hypothetical protein